MIGFLFHMLALVCCVVIIGFVAYVFVSAYYTPEKLQARRELRARRETSKTLKRLDKRRTNGNRL